MTAERVRLYWASKAHAGSTDRTEPIYGTAFSCEPLPEAWSPALAGDLLVSCLLCAVCAVLCGVGLRLDADDALVQPKPLQIPAHSPPPPLLSPPQGGELHLPAANPFIPTDFTLHTPAPGAPPHPSVVRSDARWRLFHQLELTFSQPKAVVLLDFQCPEAYASPLAAVSTRCEGGHAGRVPTAAQPCWHRPAGLHVQQLLSCFHSYCCCC